MGRATDREYTSWLVKKLGLWKLAIHTAASGSYCYSTFHTPGCPRGLGSDRVHNYHHDAVTPLRGIWTCKRCGDKMDIDGVRKALGLQPPRQCDHDSTFKCAKCGEACCTECDVGGVLSCEECEKAKLPGASYCYLCSVSTPAICPRCSKTFCAEHGDVHVVNCRVRPAFNSS